MSLINSYIFTEPVVEESFWDNTLVAYTLRDTENWTNAILKIRRDSDDATAYVFLDGASSQTEISLNSYISTSSNTTPDATTLGTWVSTDDAFTEEWIGQTEDNIIDTALIVSQTNTGRQPQFISSGVIITKGGKPTIDFLSDTRTLFSATGLPDANNTDDFSILSVSSQNITNTVGYIFKIYHPSAEYFAVLNDTRTNNRHTLIVTQGGSYHNDTLSTYTETDLKLLATIKTTTFTRTYYNGTFEQEVSQDGLAYDNARFVLGGFSDTASYNIKISEIVIFKDSDQTKISDRQTNINDFYLVY